VRELTSGEEPNVRSQPRILLAGAKRMGMVALTGIEPEGCQFIPVQLSSKWLCFQCGWYSGMLGNTATSRRRHRAVTAQRWAEGAH